jgi:hypothetical protein
MAAKQSAKAKYKKRAAQPIGDREARTRLKQFIQHWQRIKQLPQEITDDTKNAAEKERFRWELLGHALVDMSALLEYIATGFGAYLAGKPKTLEKALGLRTGKQGRPLDDNLEHRRTILKAVEDCRSGLFFKLIQNHSTRLPSFAKDNSLVQAALWSVFTKKDLAVNDRYNKIALKGCGKRRAHRFIGELTNYSEDSIRAICREMGGHDKMG